MSRDKEQKRLEELFCDMILKKENVELHDIVKTNPCFLSDHWGKRFSDFCFMQSKLDAKDELLKGAVEIIANIRCNRESAKAGIDFLSKLEIEQLRGESNG